MSQTTTETLNTPIHSPVIFSAASHPHSSPPTPSTRFAQFNYYLPPDRSSTESRNSKPSTDDLELILGSKNQDTRRLPVHNLRGRFNEFTLDRNGFCVVRLDSAEKGFEDDERIRKVYYPEIEELVRKLYPGLKQILHLGHILRGALPRTDFSGPTDAAWNKPSRNCAPATRAHIDFTHRGVELVLEQEFSPAVASQVCGSGRRFVALSVWKPIKTVRRDPLGFCDGSTVDKQDLVPLPRVYPDGREGENVLVMAPTEGRQREREGRTGVHDWYWIEEQRPEEVVVLKLFDSEEVVPSGQGAGKKRCTQTPHASFSLEGGEEVEEPRESVEVRVVVCF